jgi:hypothetical protein
MEAFVLKHDIGCFKCKKKKARWAKTGISKRGPWAICGNCVSREGPSTGPAGSRSALGGRELSN